MKKAIYVLALLSIAYFGYTHYFATSDKVETPKTDSTSVASVDSANTVKADTTKK